jgi:hypothetical protein
MQGPALLQQYYEDMGQAVRRTTELCAWTPFRFDPDLLYRVRQAEWHKSRFIHRLFYGHSSRPGEARAAVALSVDHLAELHQQGPVARQENLRGRLGRGLLNLTLRLLVAARYPDYDPDVGNGEREPPTWARALALNDAGIITLTEDARRDYQAGRPVTAQTAAINDKGSPASIAYEIDQLRSALKKRRHELECWPGRESDLLWSVGIGFALAVLPQDSEAYPNLVNRVPGGYAVESAAGSSRLS